MRAQYIAELRELENHPEGIQTLNQLADYFLSESVGRNQITVFMDIIEKLIQIPFSLESFQYHISNEQRVRSGIDTRLLEQQILDEQINEQIIIKKYGDDKFRGHRRVTSIQMAIAESDVESVRVLHSKYPELIDINESGFTSLHIAVLTDYSDLIVRLVFELSPKLLNRQDPLYRTPLYVAAVNDKVDAVKVLIGLQANPYIRNRHNDKLPIGVTKSAQIRKLLEEYMDLFPPEYFGMEK